MEHVAPVEHVGTEPMGWRRIQERVICTDVVAEVEVMAPGDGGAKGPRIEP